MADLTLAFDTSGPYVSAALLRDDRVCAQHCEAMARGQAERLVPLLEQTLQDAGISWNDLDRIGVGIGPGNFTGIRISVACARGLALALNIPAIGVSSFEAVRQIDPTARAAVPAMRDQLYVCDDDTPKLVPLAQAGSVILPPDPQSLVIAMAHVARRATPGAAPAPLYIKPADAAPAKDQAPVILDDA